MTDAELRDGSHIYRDFFHAPGSPESIAECGSCGKIVYSIYYTSISPELPTGLLSKFDGSNKESWLMHPCGCYISNDDPDRPDVAWRLYIPTSRIRLAEADT